ncbi:MAG: hypothetical protein E7529_00180 [Ruminococcaceae bacterium]|nr:hypothetical protein [Oscillospiraceae bacterium]
MEDIMNKENKKYLIPMLVAVVLMFVWIFVTVVLTGGREISDFTDTDKMFFTGFIIVELLTVASIIILIVKAQKLVNKNNTNIETNTKMPVDKRRVALTVASFVAIIATMFGGIFAKNLFDTFSENIIGIIAISTLLLPVLFLIINVIANRIYVKKLNQKSIAENQQYWLAHRDNPEKTIAKKLYLLKMLIIINDFYSVLLAVCAFVSAFFMGVISDGGGSVAPLFVCFMIISGAALRIRLKTPEKIFEEDKTYVSESDYPVLYDLAKKAAVATGCTTKIKIAILDDFNAGSANINNTISIQLGALLLNVLSEDELYCVLLHEFSHIKDEVNREKINDYYQYICDVHNNSITNTYSSITRHLFTFIDVYFNVHYKLYLYAVSLVRERAADEAMSIYGNNEIAASSLVKIKYYELYDWEKGSYDTPCNMLSEEYDTNSLNNEVIKFKKAIQLNAEKWNGLINKEILSRSATHPTLKMRLESLGVNELRILYPESSKEYVSESKKAIEYVSSLIAQQSKESYGEYRKYYYTESKELVEKWENNGRHIIAEEYSDVCDALRRLGRNTEAFELCENAIKILDDVGSCYAHFMKGCFLLHFFDETGIGYIYRAIETNHNYIDEGLEVIGRFCCLTGQEDQLEIYRERAIALAQENEIYSEASVLNKKDKLSTEVLPEGMLEDILEHITSECSDNIEKIYLVRKTITDNFFTSAFVMKMTPDTDDDTRYKILHKAFNYLDTCSDWQFSLFDYEDVKNVKIENIAGSCVYSR